MNKLRKTILGTALMGASFVGVEAYRNQIIDDVENKKLECLQEFAGQDATNCLNEMGNANYTLLGIVQLSVVIGGIAFGSETYKSIRDEQ